MTIKNGWILVIFLLAALQGASQPACSTLGQTPSTAFPVCGSSVFSQATVPQCVNNSVPASSCGSYPDTNPFWYEFTCFQSGSLGFLITPNNLGDDYDWELFDITGQDPQSVYTDPSLFVVANWCGTYGLTGTSPSALDSIECASQPSAGVSPYSRMPQVIKGHIYLLLVSHYTQTQSGYQLSFNGGTAVITDSTKPVLQNASIQCNAQNIVVKTNKKIKCTSLDPDGSDFSISFPAVSISSASGIGCANNFDVDSILLMLSGPLPPGNYQVTMQVGNDGNTLLDDCNNNIPPGDQTPFAVVPLAPTPLDSMAPVGCDPDSLVLLFQKPIQCSSIAPDGTDFVITGSTPVVVASASGNCVNGQSSQIVLRLNQPLSTAGQYQVALQRGSDGNTIIDICNLETPAGSSVKFTTVDTVSATISYQALYGCVNDSIRLTNPGGNGINFWQWNLDSAGASSSADALAIFSVFGTKQIGLKVSNGVCSDSSTISILLNNTVKAIFSTQDSICPQDKITFQNNSIGDIVSWSWDFGDGSASTEQTPSPHAYPVSVETGTRYIVRLIVQNNLGCSDTALQQVTQLRSCYINVPSAFTPNGDGLNDYLYPLNGFRASVLEFRVFNRYGQLLFETRDPSRKWDGTFNGKPQDPGTYVWMLQYTDRDSGKSFFLKGTSVLIR